MRASVVLLFASLVPSGCYIGSGDDPEGGGATATDGAVTGNGTSPGNGDDPNGTAPNEGTEGGGAGDEDRGGSEAGPGSGEPPGGQSGTDDGGNGEASGPSSGDGGGETGGLDGGATDDGGGPSDGGNASDGGGDTSGGQDGGGTSAGQDGGDPSGGQDGGDPSTAGSEGGAMDGGDPSGGDPGDPFEAARQACVDRINGFRATEGKPPLDRWYDAEMCTDEQSADDASSGVAHANFGACGERGQNTCPGWKGLDRIINDCLQLMWDEGPGEPFSEHGHYLNMSSTKFTKVACGFYEMPDGKIWHNQNFR